MARITENLVIQRVGDLLVIVDDSTGAETVIPVDAGVRLTAMAAYLTNPDCPGAVMAKAAEYLDLLESSFNDGDDHVGNDVPRGAAKSSSNPDATDMPEAFREAFSFLFRNEKDDRKGSTNDFVAEGLKEVPVDVVTVEDAETRLKELREAALVVLGYFGGEQDRIANFFKGFSEGVDLIGGESRC